WANQNDGSVRAVKIGGGNHSTLTTGQSAPGPGMAVNASFLFWTNSGDNSVVKFTFLTSSPTKVAMGQTGVGYAALGGKYLYWSATMDGNIMSYDSTLSTVTTIASSQSGPVGVASDTNNVYWANSNDGTVEKQPVANGSPSGGSVQIALG